VRRRESATRPDEEREPDAVQAVPPGAAATVMSLQRTAGNAAVGRMLQRWPMPAPPKAADHTADDKQLRTYLQAEDWAGVVAILWHYDDAADRRQRAMWLNLWQAIKVAEYVRPGGAGGKHPDVMLPLMEEGLKQKLDSVYPQTLRDRNWSMVAILLNAYNEADVLPRARQIQQVHGAAGVSEAVRYASMMLPAENVVMRALAFLPLEGKTGAAARPFSQPAMNERGAAGPAVNVPGGKVTTYKDAGDVLTSSGWTALVYEGPDAQQTGWLQFACREAVMYDDKDQPIGYETRPTAPIKGQPETLHWGTPTDPHWHLDAQSTDYPFYESPDAQTGKSGAHVTTVDTTAIYDLPDPGTKVQRVAFSNDPRPAKLVERVKLHSYLVRGMEVLYENLVIVEFTSHGPADAPVRNNVAGVGGEVGRILPVHHEALVRRFPDWTFYARR